jgi:hypothetical protein
VSDMTSAIRPTVAQSLRRAAVRATLAPVPDDVVDTLVCSGRERLENCQRPVDQLRSGGEQGDLETIPGEPSQAQHRLRPATPPP